MTREEAIKNIKEHCYFANLIPKAKEALDMAIEALQIEPCEDVEFWKGVILGDMSANNVEKVQPKQKTGHWIEHPHEAGPNWEYSRYECSECHEWSDDNSNYCPNCGDKKEV